MRVRAGWSTISVMLVASIRSRNLEFVRFAVLYGWSCTWSSWGCQRSWWSGYPLGAGAACPQWRWLIHTPRWDFRTKLCRFVIWWELLLWTTKDKKVTDFDLLLVGNSGTVCSEFSSREKSGGVGVDSHLWGKLSSPTDLKIDFGASYIPFVPEELYSSVLGITTQHRPDNDQVKYKYSESPFFGQAPSVFGRFPNRSGAFKKGTSHP